MEPITSDEVCNNFTYDITPCCKWTIRCLIIRLEYGVVDKRS